MSIYKGTSLLAGLPDVSGKANTDMDNLSNTGKSLISGLGMPSDNYDDLTLGASGATYTAPANGWFIFRKTATGAGQYIGATNLGKNGTSNIADSCIFATGNGAQLAVTIPAKKGDIIGYGYTTAGATITFRFVYAEGEENV